MRRSALLNAAIHAAGIAITTALVAETLSPLTTMIAIGMTGPIESGPSDADFLQVLKEVNPSLGATNGFVSVRVENVPYLMQATPVTNADCQHIVAIPDIPDSPYQPGGRPQTRTMSAIICDR